MSLRVLVADGSAACQKVILETLADIPGIEVVASVADGRVAFLYIQQAKPDLAILDLDLPGMSGSDILKKLSALSDGSQQCPGVLLLSSQGNRGSLAGVRAMELGSFEFILKPDSAALSRNPAFFRALLTGAINAFIQRKRLEASMKDVLACPWVPAKGRFACATQPQPVPAAFKDPIPAKRGKSEIVVIGVSTGGPNALARMLPLFPGNLGVPVLIVQHMPEGFTEPLARHLDSKCSIRIKEAEDREAALPGWGYVAPAGMHMGLVCGPGGTKNIRLSDDPPEHSCKPSADFLFRSVAKSFPGRATAVIMTGMGSDGARGMKLLRDTGCVTIAQSEETCAVFGMPKEAIRLRCVDRVVALDQIAGEVIRSLLP